ncbi:Nn.00g081680.m01.CDS01 [Neocucurbitaria sp. VM-36]
MRSLALIALATGASALALPEVSDALQNILKNTHKSDTYKYPTDFTREIVPKPLHSHNDYWRDVPFYSGLSYGAISTEADVWLINGTLYVGHEPAALSEKRTLDSLYIQPILDTLHRLNPSTKFVQPGKPNGVFDTSSGQTFYLFIDLKTPADVTWPAVVSALEPLRSGKWLSTYNGTEFNSNPITVIGTGNTQLADVQKLEPRDVFFDAPLEKLNTTQYSSLTANESPIASTNFASSFGDVKKREFNSTQLDLLQKQVGVAHEKGIKTRYWNQPAYPIGTRNAVWRTLWDENVDLVNVDDLRAAAEFWEGTG